MEKESPLLRGQLRGYIFEIIIRKLLELNNFSVVSKSVKERVKNRPSIDQVGDKYPSSTPQVLEFCRESKRRDEIQTHLGLKDRKYLRTVTLVPLVKQGLLTMTIPDKPRSPQQRYMITEKGKK